MRFWFRHILFGVFLIAIAVALFQNIDRILPLFNGEEGVEEFVSTIDRDDLLNSKNKAAEGLSKFYASIRPNLDKTGPVIKENVVYLEEPEGDLVKILAERARVIKPINKRWKGPVKSRPFRKGETLFQKLSEYGQDAGMEVFWWLDKDFLIKNPFRIDQSIIDTAFKIGSGVNGHFINGVKVYFCNKQRAIVLIEKDLQYLSDNCQLIEPANSRES